MFPSPPDREWGGRGGKTSATKKNDQEVVWFEQERNLENVNDKAGIP